MEKHEKHALSFRERGRRTRFLIVRLKPGEIIKYREAATKAGYIELSAWVRHILDRASGKEKGVRR